MDINRLSENIIEISEQVITTKTVDLEKLRSEREILVQELQTKMVEIASWEAEIAKIDAQLNDYEKLPIKKLNEEIIK